jgi:hypothetical protein
MPPFVYILVGIVVVVMVKSAWTGRRRRPHEEGYGYVYINQDGSAREVTESERVYLETDFAGGDGGRPYIKPSYGSKDGWGSTSGFIQRRQVPARIPIARVASPNLPDEGNCMEDMIADSKAVGDVVEHGADGSVRITPNPSMNGKERFRLLAERQLQQQRDREDAVMSLLKKDAVEQDVTPNA